MCVYFWSFWYVLMYFFRKISSIIFCKSLANIGRFRGYLEIPGNQYIREKRDIRLRSRVSEEIGAHVHSADRVAARHLRTVGATLPVVALRPWQRRPRRAPPTCPPGARAAAGRRAVPMKAQSLGSASRGGWCSGAERPQISMFHRDASLGSASPRKIRPYQPVNTAA